MEAEPQVIDGSNPVDETPIIDPKAHEEIKNDMFKYKSKLKEREAELNQFKAQIEESKKQQMVEQERYKELYEQAEQRANNAEGRYKSFRDAFKNDKKMSVIEKEALQAGIRPEALEDLRLLDSESVILEMTDQGRTNVLGAKEFVENLKQSKGHWFTDSTPPNVNGSIPTANLEAKILTPAELLELSRKDPAAYREHMKKRQGLRI